MLNEKMELKEAIKWFEEQDDCNEFKKSEAMKTALSTMKTLQLYKEGKLCLIPDQVFKKQCNMLDAYKECGTLETVQDAVNKQESKPIEVWNGQACCPCCRKMFGNVIDIMSLRTWDMPYCKWCGQKLNWKVVR